MVNDLSINLSDLDSKFNQLCNKLYLDLTDLMSKLDKSPDQCIDQYAQNLKLECSTKSELKMVNSLTPEALLGGELFSFTSAYHAIENHDYDLALEIMISISRGLTMAEMLHNEKNAISKKMRAYAKQRLKNDPIQLAKAEIEQEYWQQKGQFKRRGYSAEFKRKMAKKHPVITDIKTIERLITKLNKQNDDYPSS